MGANIPGQLSSDGAYYWDGQQWVTTLSPDGAHRWNGAGWIPTAASSDPVSPPPPASSSVPYGTIPAAAAPRRSGLGFQFGGSAAWSIGFGAVSILLPLITSATSGATTYFVVLPLLGLYRGFIAVRLGRVAGGGAGIALNLLGGVISLLASGILHG